MAKLSKGKASAFIREQMAKGKTTSQIVKLASQRGIKFSANLPYVVKHYDKTHKAPAKARKASAPKAPKLSKSLYTANEREYLRLALLVLGTERATQLLNDFKQEVERRLA